MDTITLEPSNSKEMLQKPLAHNFRHDLSRMRADMCPTSGPSGQRQGAEEVIGTQGNDRNRWKQTYSIGRSKEEADVRGQRTESREKKTNNTVIAPF